MKKIIAKVLVLGAIVLGTSVNVVKADENISIEDAKQMAWMQVNSVREQKQDIREWSSNLKIDDSQRLYDCDNNITAYCINFSDKYNNDCGYVVVGANDDYEPIIEFATEGEFFTEKNEKTYYIGGYDYFVKKNDNILEKVSDKTDMENKYISKKEAKKLYEKESHESEWDFYKENYLQEDSDMEIDTKGASVQTITNKDASYFIYDPYELEDDWISIAPIDAAKYNITYFSTSDFSGYDNHCAPTAGVNLMLYWQNKNSSKYGKLKYKNSWNSSFKKIHKYMKTSNKNGTYNVDIAPGIKKYLNLCGFSKSTVKHITSPTFDDVIWELDNGGASRPFIFCMQNHKVYGNHAVLAVGYMEFEYKTKQKILGGKYSRYLRIADGWNKAANRFVHFKVGHTSSEREMITVKIK